MKPKLLFTLNDGGKVGTIMTAARIFLYLVVCLWVIGPIAGAAAVELQGSADQPAVEQPANIDQAVPAEQTAVPDTIPETTVTTPEASETPASAPVSQDAVPAAGSLTVNPAIDTDKADYSPGQTVAIFGSGFLPDEPVLITIENASSETVYQNLATAAGDGSVANLYVIPIDGSASSLYTLTATGQTSGAMARTTFTDCHAKIEGYKYNDINGNGVKDSGELGLAGWTIYLDANDNGALDSGEMSTTTSSNGYYYFDGLGGGTFKVKEVQQSGWTKTYPDDCHTITFPADIDRTYSDNNFLNCQSTGSISGTKYEDVNRSGAKDSGEPGLAGWTIYLDTDNDGSLDIGEQTTTTASDGSFVFAGLPQGTYHVKEVQQSGWIKIAPATSGYDAVVTAENTSSGKDFGNYPYAAISGMKFNDLNGNGVKDSGEPGLPGWTIYLDTNNNGVLDSGETTAMTSTGGSYSFANLIHGATYHVKEVQQSGWIKTMPAASGYDVALTCGQQATGLNFGNHQNIGSLSGMKFNDLNGNGVKDAGEPGLAEWIISVFGPSVGSATTAADGSYSINNLISGTYTVIETQQSGWTPTSPTSGSQTAAVSDSANTPNVNFGNFHNVSISGQKFSDLNGNGVKDNGEPGLSAWTIYLDTDNDGINDAGEPTTTTNASGVYTFSNLGPGTYRVTEVNQTGWTRTYPTDPGTHVVAAQSGTDVTGQDFGNCQTTSTSGMKFNDLNGNGVKDSGEPGLAGWTIYLDTDNDSVNDQGETSATTNSSGAYVFANLAPGTYHVKEIQQAGWTKTTPATSGRDVSLVAGQAGANIDFGNFHNFTKTFALTVNEPILGATYYVDYTSSAGNGTLSLVRDGTTNTYKADTSTLTGATTFTSWTWRVMNGASTIWSKTVTGSELLTSHATNSYAMSYAAVVSPHTATNQVGEAHSFTATVTANDGQPLTNLPVYYSVTSPATASPAPPQTTNASGAVTFSVNSSSATTATIRAWVNETDGSSTGYDTGEATDTGTKNWVDYNIGVTPLTATNVVGEDHTVTVTLTEDTGSGYAPVIGQTVNLNLTPALGPGYIYSVNGVVRAPGTVSTTGVTQTAAGTITVVIRTIAPGTSTLTAAFPYAVASGTVTATGSGDKTWQYGSISGMKFNDLNGNGVKDSGEPGLAGWHINATGANGNGNATTDGNGNYTITNLAAGSYTVSEIQQAGWTQTYPSSGTHTVSIVTGNANPTGLNFGNFHNLVVGLIRGIVWNDVNADGVIQTTESRLSGWTVTLYAADDTTVLGTRLSASDGSYRFENLALGTYFVTETLFGPEWSNTTPIRLRVVLAYDEANKTVPDGIADFGNNQPFLPFTPSGSSLAYTGGLWYFDMSLHGSSHLNTAATIAQQTDIPGLLLKAALVVGIIAFGVAIINRRRHNSPREVAGS